MAPGTSVVCCVSRRIFFGRRSIARVPGGNASREFPVVRIIETNLERNRTRTRFFGTRGFLCFTQSAQQITRTYVLHGTYMVSCKTPKRVGGAPQQPRKHAASLFRSRTARVRAAQSAGTLTTTEKTGEALRTHDTPTKRSGAMRSVEGGRWSRHSARAITKQRTK